MVTALLVPAFLSANSPVAVPEKLTVSPSITPVSVAEPLTVATVVPSYSLFRAVMPLTVSGLAVIVLVVLLAYVTV